MCWFKGILYSTVCGCVLPYFGPPLGIRLAKSSKFFQKLF
ncbi:hypothetical protein HHE03_18430 [Helicobacter heilmannii]|nr:hypothetical protein HHE03_18430 [Helicobacter heilmannii]